MPKFPDWLTKYIGIPYATAGRTLEGCDCWGLVTLIWEHEFGKPLPEYGGLHWAKGQDPKLIGENAASYVSQFTRLDPGHEAMGDGILLRMRGHPLHVGLVIEPGWMLHTHEEADSCIERYDSPTWERRTLGFYRYEA